jgi:hypothetical protein
MSPLPKPIGQPWRHLPILTLTIDNLRPTQHKLLAAALVTDNLSESRVVLTQSKS